MKHSRLLGTGVWLLVAGLGACVPLPAADELAGDVAAYSCTDPDRDPKMTTQCHAGCSQRREQGCPCRDEGAATSCFITGEALPDDKLMCTEGTRVCRAGLWSGCENTHDYVVAKQTDQQAIIAPTGGDTTCNKCDVLCFRAIDSLKFADGNAGGTVTFAPGGGITIQTVAGSGSGSGTNSCLALEECCYGLIDPLLATCRATAAAGVMSTCTSELDAYCRARVISGPMQGCTPGTGIDTDCDGIPNPVDAANGYPQPDTKTQAIFHELGPGKSATDTLTIEYKINSADIYILFDTTGTMADARKNLSDLLTTTNVVHCAQLAQCCRGDSACQSVVAAGNATDCYNGQVTYCAGHVDCADNNNDGLPDNDLATKGVLGGINCLIADAHFGLGGFRDIPVYDDSISDCAYEGCRYGDRDEQLFRHMVDITSSQAAISTALGSLSMNYNWDAPEGANLALYSLATGRGHYFGIDRPAVPDRTDRAGCPADTFGYPCFRKKAVPVVLLFTDAPQHNGPSSSAWATDSQECAGRGPGCPYSALANDKTYTSKYGADSATDRMAHYVPISAENSSTAYPLGDVRGKYYSVVGDTTHMKNDYVGSKITCTDAATDAAPDAVIKFEVSASSATPNVNINFHLTKDDAYPDPGGVDPSYYGEWTTWLPGPDDPTPATDFSTVLAVFKGTPETTAAIDCRSDKQPAVLDGTNWHKSPVDMTLSLGAGTYYAVIKGISPAGSGHFQLQIGEASTAVTTEYTTPLWAETSAALQTAKVRVIPVLATGPYPDFVSTAEKQAETLASSTGAMRSDGTTLWYSLQENAASKTGQAVVESIADLSKNLAMSVTLTAADGPDSASAFQMNVTPKNTVNCKFPHPLVDSDGACSKTSPGIECNTQYDCRPGAVPRFEVTFTNPLAPNSVAPNTRAGSFGGYLFKLQLKQDKQYLLAEIPVFLIPNQVTAPPPPYRDTGVYEQRVDAKSCLAPPVDAGTTVDLPNNLPTWGDLYFEADVPNGTSIDFQLCTSDNEDSLEDCDWRTRKRITVSGKGTCTLDRDCVDATGLGYGACATNGVCRFITPAKVYPGKTCLADSDCLNGPLGAGDYLIKSRCDTDTNSLTYKRCLAVSMPADIGGTLGETENGLLYSKVHVTLHSTPAQDASPQLYQWFVTYTCRTGL